MSSKNRKSNRWLGVTVLAFAIGIPAGSTGRDMNNAGPQAVISAASGLGVNLAAVGRLVGANDTLFKTAVDVSNNAATATQIDFYFDGVSNGLAVSANGSISSTGAVVAQGGGGAFPGRHNAHFDDFVDALVQAGLIPANVEPNGIIGSTLFVFDKFTRSGQGAVTARFYNAGCGGTVGQAINGREITTKEPTKLVVTARNTVGEDGPQLYTNLFVNNTGLTPTGAGAPSAVDVLVSATSATTGAPVGTPLVIHDLAAGATAPITVFPALQIPEGVDTVIVTIEVTSGNSAIDAVAVALDNATHDGTTTKAVNGSF